MLQKGYDYALLILMSLFQVCSRTYGQNLGPPSSNGLDFWQSERPKDMANIVDLEVMCGKRHMEVAVTFDKPFNGIIFSKVIFLITVIEERAPGLFGYGRFGYGRFG